MSSIVRGEANTTSKINWFITVDDALNDAYEVGFRILDITSSLPGTQVFPATPGNYEDVTSAPGHFGVGRYHAYDNASAVAWTPSLAASLGTHRIVWRWKIFSASTYQTGQEDFEVLAEAGVPPGEKYISVQDIRDEGITIAMASDAKVLSYICTWQAMLDRACRQWFVSKLLTLKINGNDSDTLFFGVPIISIDYVKLNSATTALGTDLYKVYNSRDYPDDRRNPKISLVGPGDYRDIYIAPLLTGAMKFRRGYQNQEIKGYFGFLEPDDSTPEAIKRALTKLVVEKLARPIFHNPSAGPPSVPELPPLLGPLLQEKTDDHMQKWGQAGGALKPRRPGLTGITTDQEILDIIRMYKAPLGVATPAHWGLY